MWVLIREASNARNLRALLALVREYGPDYCAFCTDDREPDFLYREGHIDQMCRVAVDEGIAAEDALLMATLHGARAHRLLDRGAIAPGYLADLVVLDDLTASRRRSCFKDGREPVVSARRRPTALDRHDALASPCRPPIAGEPAAVRVIEIVPGQLITGAGSDTPRLDDGHVVADPSARPREDRRDRAPPRDRPRRPRPRARLRAAAGAFASTVAHDAHNLVVVGVDDDDMLACAARAQELGGGLVVARDGDVRGELALPIAGLLSAGRSRRSSKGSRGCRSCCASRASRSARRS